MTRRQGLPLNGAQYCANTSPSKKEVHDLDNEKAPCQIDEIACGPKIYSCSELCLHYTI